MLSTPGSSVGPVHPSTTSKNIERSLVQSQVGPSPIGSPITFRTGPFAGLTLRVKLEELQKADLGRKYVHHDFFA